jgi:hypothetical protein
MRTRLFEARDDFLAMILFPELSDASRTTLAAAESSLLVRRLWCAAHPVRTAFRFAAESS